MMYFEDCVEGVSESLRRLDEDYLDIDIQSVYLCIELLNDHVRKSDCRVNVEPEVPPEIKSALALLEKIRSDLCIVSDTITEDIKDIRNIKYADTTIPH